MSDMADIGKKGKELLDLCSSREHRIAEIKKLFNNLTEDKRRDVVNYKDDVRES